MWADRNGAQTPEELETLLEDALILRDSRALSTLFAPGASLNTGRDPPARNREAIVRLALATWGGAHPYVADPRQIVVARDLALIIGEQGIHVAHRDRDGAWQYAIVLQRLEDGKERETIMTSETISTQRLQPVAVAKDDGDARWWFGGLAVIKATAADTGGQMAIIEVTEPPDAEAPLHVHHREDEGFWLLEGSATFEVGGATIEAYAGDYVFGPRDIPHRYTVGKAGCRMLFIMTPGGFEEFVIATSEPAASRTLPPPSEQEPDFAWLATMAQAYGGELLG